MLATTFEVGSRLEVEEGGVWYPVRVTHVDESRVCIHFEGWSQRYDKWLEKDSENIRVLRKQHTMKRRSRTTDDSERPPKRASTTTLKVGGVFLAGARKSTRKSADASKDITCRSNNSAVVEQSSSLITASTTATTSTTTTAAAAAATTTSTTTTTAATATTTTSTTITATTTTTTSSTSTPTSSRTSSSHGQHVTTSSKTSRDSKERNSTRTLRDTKEKDTQKNIAAVAQNAAQVPSTTSTAGGAAGVPIKGTPPVGWAYEVVTSAQDLLPKKAFTINEDHNDFKCTQENCNKSFRKEKLLQSHLKHYHNVNVEAIHSPPSSSSTALTAATSSSSTTATVVAADSKRRRPLGRRTRNGTADEERPVDKSKEATLDTIAETSSSTDISNVTLIDTVEGTATPTAPPVEAKALLAPQLPIADANQSLKSQTAAEKCPDASSTPAPASGPTEQSSASVGNPVPRTPLYGRVGQNRFVPIPEPLVLGREKRKVVKTERMQEAESTLIKKQKAETGAAQVDKKEKRRRSQGGDTGAADSEEQQGIILAKAEAPSDDEATISSPKALVTTDSKAPLVESLVEKDMVHCPCGVEEESGLMMQCDLCLCWQHGSCFGLENEKHVPERYVCIACQNARRVLQKQAHQVAAFRAMAEGRLPSLVPGSTSHPQRFLNLTKIAETMANLRKALRGIEIRILRVYQDTNRSLPERRILLDAAVADADCIQRQMEICEKILAAIDRPANDQGSEALILRSTVKSVLKDLWTVQRLTLFR